MAKKQIIFPKESLGLDTWNDVENLRRSGAKIKTRSGPYQSIHGTQKQLLDYFSNYYIVDWDGAGGMREKFSNQMTDESKLKLSKLNEHQLWNVADKSFNMMEDLETYDEFGQRAPANTQGLNVNGFHPEVLTKKQRRALHEKLDQMNMLAKSEVASRNGVNPSPIDIKNDQDINYGNPVFDSLLKKHGKV